MRSRRHNQLSLSIARNKQPHLRGNVAAGRNVVAMDSGKRLCGRCSRRIRTGGRLEDRDQLADLDAPFHKLCGLDLGADVRLQRWHVAAAAQRARAVLQGAVGMRGKENRVRDSNKGQRCEQREPRFPRKSAERGHPRALSPGRRQKEAAGFQKNPRLENYPIPPGKACAAGTVSGRQAAADRRPAASAQSPDGD